MTTNSCPERSLKVLSNFNLGCVSTGSFDPILLWQFRLMFTCYYQTMKPLWEIEQLCIEKLNNAEFEEY